MAVDAFAGLGLGLPGWTMLWNSMVLNMPDMPVDRKYDMLAYRNPFRGGLTADELRVEYPVKPKEVNKKDDDEGDEPLLILGNDLRKFVRLVWIHESTQDVNVIVKPAGSSDYPFKGFATFDPDVPIVLTPDKAKTVDMFVKLQTRKGDFRGDRIDSISPAGKGVTAELRGDGSLKLSARKDAVPGNYAVTIKVKRAVLRNQVTDAYPKLSTRSFYNSFLVKSEDGQYDQARGTVIYIDHRDIYFKAREIKGKEGIYCWHEGESLYDAMKQPLKASELQQLDWWALSPLATSTLGLLSSPGPGPGPLLASFALYPDRPGLRTSSEPVTVEFGGKTDKIGE